MCCSVNGSVYPVCLTVWCGVSVFSVTFTMDLSCSKCDFILYFMCCSVNLSVCLVCLTV